MSIKRGISPLIASVLMIAFAVTLFLIISSFVRQEVVDTSLEASVGQIASANECDGTNMKVVDAVMDSGQIKVHVSNEGNEKIEGYAAKFSGSVDGYVEQKQTSLEVLATKIESFTIDGIGAVEDIELFPITKSGLCRSGFKHKIKGSDYTHFLDSSILASYDFEDGGLDVSGWGRDGVLNNVDCSVSGKKGEGCSFTGNGDINLGSGWNPVNDFSIEAWVKTSQSVAESITYFDPAIIGTDGNLGYSTDWILNIRDGFLSWFGQLGGSNFQSTFYIADNKWYHIAVVREGSDLFLYGNGELITQEAAGGSQITPHTLYLGRFGWPGADYYEGLIDEVTIYNRALTKDEIKEHASL
jgi:flagellin-like protein